MAVVIGTAGWSLPAHCRSSFPAAGTALERYSRVFGGVEVNSSFHRPHRASTWEKWAASVPGTFRFAVKLPKTITHQAKLVDVTALTAQFVRDLEPLEGKLAILLVQLPPKLAFDADVADRFFSSLQPMTRAEIACEPRNPSWFEPEADALLGKLRVARVAADPALSTSAAVPGGWRGLGYWRLHGSPAMYRSSYSEDALHEYARRIGEEADAGHDTWCMFDNTAASAATSNALSLMARLSDELPARIQPG